MPAPHYVDYIFHPQEWGQEPPPCPSSPPSVILTPHFSPLYLSILPPLRRWLDPREASSEFIKNRHPLHCPPGTPSGPWGHGSGTESQSLRRGQPTPRTGTPLTNERSQQTVNGLILFRKSQGRLVILDVNEGVTHCLEKVVPGNLPLFGCLPQWHFISHPP